MMNEADLLEKRSPTINLAIGPTCPVRCEGCYNHFGNTSKNGGLVTARQVIEFALNAVDLGVEQATLSGGDPLFHPEIVDIAAGLSDLGMRVKVDTVGTALLGDTAIKFKGKGVVPKVDIDLISPFVDFLSVPLDGASQQTVEKFRRGRRHLFDETIEVAGILRSSGVRFGLNTVANTANIHELHAILRLAETVGASEWQVFEYDPEGPNPSHFKEELRLAPGLYDEAVALQNLQSEHLSVVCKNLEQRSGAYFLVDDSGIAWKPLPGGMRRIWGHIVNDRAQVLESLRQHISVQPSGSI